MNVEFINPFLEATVNVLSTMATLEAKPGKPTLKQDNVARGDVTGIIGMTSPRFKGSLSLTFTEPVILEIVKRMLGEEIQEIDETATDLAGEITNMVSGGAKKSLVEKGYDFDMAIPAIVAGKEHTVDHRFDGPKIIIPFQCDYGQFFVEVCFEQ